MKEDHFRQVADFLHQAVTIALTLQATSGIQRIISPFVFVCWFVSLFTSQERVSRLCNISPPGKPLRMLA